VLHIYIYIYIYIYDIRRLRVKVRDARRITAMEIPGKTIEENSGCERPEWVNKWPNPMITTWWWWWWWWWLLHYSYYSTFTICRFISRNVHSFSFCSPVPQITVYESSYLYITYNIGYARSPCAALPEGCRRVLEVVSPIHMICDLCHMFVGGTYNYCKYCDNNCNLYPTSNTCTGTFCSPCVTVKVLLL